MRTRHLWTLAVVVAVAGCGGAEEAETRSDPDVAVDSVTMAAEAFDPTVFDTLTWESEQEAVERGGVVFTYSCAKCHGPRGFGDGGFVRQGDTLRPPSFHQASWEYAQNPGELRKMIFTGGEGGMPHWGLEGLQYRDVDAVATFILEGMRGGDSSGS